MLRYLDQLGKRKRAQATNLWNEPVDDTHMERDDDRELYNLLQNRARLRRGSEVGDPGPCWPLGLPEGPAVHAYPQGTFFFPGAGDV